MHRIDRTITAFKENGKKMLSPYITAGDPSLASTVPLMHALVQAGADILEIGIPFSDPMAEGPVIQAAMERSLKQGITCDQVLDSIATFRTTDPLTPVVLMGYVNPLEYYGYARFAKRAQEAGVDGTILVDLPPEESEMIASIWEAHGLYPIYLCSPTTSDKRLAMINHYARGYVYYVSLKGVTGASHHDLSHMKTDYLYKKSQINLPLMVGFGIKTAVTAAQITSFADGAIVGAALISRIIEAYDTKQNIYEAGASLIHEMRGAIDKNG